MSRQLTLSAMLSSLMMLGFVLANESAPSDMVSAGNAQSVLSVTAEY